MDTDGQQSLSIVVESSFAFYVIQQKQAFKNALRLARLACMYPWCLIQWFIYYATRQQKVYNEQMYECSDGKDTCT